jgi:MFS family permease
MKMLAGQSISELGSEVTMLALPLVAILTLHAGALQVGVLTAVEFAPFILVGLPAGVWVDRLARRRPILIVADAGRLLVIGSIPIAAALDHLSLPQLFVVGFISGILTVFFDVAYQSYVPALVSRDQLVDGNAKLEFTRSAAQLTGPAIAGGLVGAVGAPVAMSADAVSFGVSVISLLTIRKREQGRMNATMRFLVWGTIPIGNVLGGVLGASLGLRTTMAIGSAGTLLAVIPVALSPVRSLRTIEEAIPPELMNMTDGGDGVQAAALAREMPLPGAISPPEPLAR